MRRALRLVAILIELQLRPVAPIKTRELLIEMISIILLRFMAGSFQLGTI